MTGSSSVHDRKLSVPSLWKLSTDVLFSADPVLRGRSSMALLAVLLMAKSSCVMIWLAYAGYATADAVMWWCIWANGGLLVMALMVRTSLTATWNDPALTFPQVIWAITSSAIAYGIAGEAKGVVPGLLAVSLLFAALSLRSRQIIMVTLYAFAAFSIAALAAADKVRAPRAAHLEWAYAAVLVIMLLGCMLLSLRLYALRRRLHQQRKELISALEANRELASRDPLTGLLNRRHMLELMHLEQRRCMRGARHMLLAQLDLDYFKAINDNFGHSVGDHALLTFCQVVQANIRTSDILSRWGGEEFVLLLSDTNLAGAQMTLERVRQAVEQAVIEGAPSMFRMTVSIGVAQHIPGESVERTLDRADRALYCAKHAGRNQVVVGELPLPSSIASSPVMASSVPLAAAAAAQQVTPVQTP